MNHTINLVFVAGLVVYDDRGREVSKWRLPFVTLFFWLPALVWNWLTPPQRKAPAVTWPKWVMEVGDAAAWLWEIYFGGGIYWRLVMG